jgi:hypothetical protein
VAFEGIPSPEAMVEEACQECFLFAEGHHAIAQVARGQHVKASAQPAGRAAIVGYRDNRSQIRNLSWGGAGLAGGHHVAAQAAQ